MTEHKISLQICIWENYWSKWKIRKMNNTQSRAAWNSMDGIKSAQTNLTQNDRLKFKTVTIADVHARDVIDSFVEHHINDRHNFQWTSRLRFYWFREEDNLFVVHFTGKKLHQHIYIIFGICICRYRCRCIDCNSFSIADTHFNSMQNLTQTWAIGYIMKLVHLHYLFGAQCLRV